jgi:hypothetical protein
MTAPAAPQTRLYWVGMRGSATLNGRCVRLTHPPQLPGVQVEAIDYAPGLRVAMVMPRRSGWRDMTGEEISAAAALLATLTAGADTGAAP